MRLYDFPEGQRRFVEGMRLPFVVCQILPEGVVTLAVSDGFCELFGFEDREQAYTDMNQNMFKDVHQRTPRRSPTPSCGSLLATTGSR